MAKPKSKPTLEAQYLERMAQGPAAFLREKGADGKRLARCAFDGTFQPYGPFEASDDAALQSVVRDLLQLAFASYRSKFSSDDPALLVQTAKHTARTLHTHSGKYLQAETGSKYLSLPGEDTSAYLSSASAAGMRSITAGFPHAPKHSTAAKLFIANIRRDGRVVTIAELVADGNACVKAEFLAAGLSEAEYAQAQAHLRNALRNEETAIDLFLPQLLWPTPAGDIALTAVPALAVYNSITAMRAQVSENAYLTSGSFAVGSGQAQNISVAATSVAGNLPLLKCVPPSVYASGNRVLVSRAHGRRLTERLPTEVAEKFFVPIHDWPNEARHRFLKYAARKHATLVLEAALDLREAVLDGEVLLDELPESQHAVVRLARGASVSEELAGELMKTVLDALPNEKKGMHAPADWTHYYGCLKAVIQEMGA